MANVYSQGFTPTGYKYQSATEAPAPQPAKQGFVQRALVKLGLAVDREQVATAQRAGSSSYTANAKDVVSRQGLMGLQTGASGIQRGRATDEQLEHILRELGA